MKFLFAHRALLIAGVLAGPFASTLVAPALVSAQPAQTVAVNGSKDTPGASSRLLEEVRQQLAKGRAQFDAGQIASVETLRGAAQKSLSALISYIGPQVLASSEGDLPQNGFLAAAIRQAAEAQYWFGRAADQFGQRDEAIVAFARAVRFSDKTRDGNDMARDSLLALGGTLRDGLPEVAPDDALNVIADVAHGRLWTPRRFAVDFSEISWRPLSAGESTLSLDPNAGVREFLVTSGRLYPPVPNSAVDVSAALSRVPPLYRTVSADALPDVLKMDRMAVGYEREVTGESKGLWRQVVRVFYSSTYLTKDRREDRPRAEALCAQFLKVHALMKNALGLQNPWVKDGVTTLWLSEVSSIWPRDDDDPRVREAVGSQMPKINVPTKGQTAPTEIDTPPTMIAWNAAGQTDSSPGEIMFFKMTAARDEAEWLRELMHEYGHVSLPPIGGFRPPLEPYGNGLVGETLGMMWVAESPAAWKLPIEITGKPQDDAMAVALTQHVQRNAFASLRYWRAQGPASAMRRDGAAAGLQYLQGFSTYIERVYGGPVLGHASAPLIAKAVNASDPLARLTTLRTESLMASIPGALRDAFGSSVTGNDIRVVVGADTTSRVLPLWLGGALELPNQSADDLIRRAPVKLKSGERVSGWLYVPAPASTLRLEWQSANRAADALQLEGSKATSTAPRQTGATQATLFDIKARTGWQRFTFLARADVTILASQFEK
jgi:hypothetical protein